MPRMKMYWLCLAVALGACGFGRDGSTVPDFGGFDPDPPPGGGRSDLGLGDGFARFDGGTRTVDFALANCAESERRCGREFALLSNGSEREVELRGNYRPNGWDVGVPMTLSIDTWRVAVELPWNTEVQYKFRIVFQNGAVRWIEDPTNPNTVPDGQGGLNSVIAPFTCAQWTCAN